MSGSYKAALDVEEQLLRIEQMEADIRQKEQAMANFRAQFYVNALLAGSALVTAVFAVFKAFYGH